MSVSLPLGTHLHHLLPGTNINKTWGVTSFIYKKWSNPACFLEEKCAKLCRPMWVVTQWLDLLLFPWKDFSVFFPDSQPVLGLLCYHRVVIIYCLPCARDIKAMKIRSLPHSSFWGSGERISPRAPWWQKSRGQNCREWGRLPRVGSGHWALKPSCRNLEGNKVPQARNMRNPPRCALGPVFCLTLPSSSAAMNRGLEC